MNETSRKNIEQEERDVRFEQWLRLSTERHAEIKQLYADMASGRHKDLRVSQQAVLQNELGEVLILHESVNDNWLLPGGRMEINDSDIPSALQREVVERLGVEIEIGRPLGVDINRTGTIYAVAFLCKIVSGEIRLSDEHDKYKWVMPAQLEDYLYYKNIASAIAQQLA